MSQDICLQSKTTADNAACPAATTASPDVIWPKTEAHFFMQVASVANASTAKFDKNIYNGEWSISGACSTATLLVDCKQF